VNEQGQTLLHLAIHLRYRELVQKLIDWGIDLNVRDVNGSTALHAAYLCDDLFIVAHLEASGATKFVLDELGRPPTELTTVCPSPGGVISEEEIAPGNIGQLKEQYKPPVLAEPQETELESTAEFHPLKCVIYFRSHNQRLTRRFPMICCPAPPLPTLLSLRPSMNHYLAGFFIMPGLQVLVPAKSSSTVQYVKMRDRTLPSPSPLWPFYLHAQLRPGHLARSPWLAYHRGRAVHGASIASCSTIIPSHSTHCHHYSALEARLPTPSIVALDHVDLATSQTWNPSHSHTQSTTVPYSSPGGAFPDSRAGLWTPSSEGTLVPVEGGVYGSPSTSIAPPRPATRPDPGYISHRATVENQAEKSSAFEQACSHLGFTQEEAQNFAFGRSVTVPPSQVLPQVAGPSSQARLAPQRSPQACGSPTASIAPPRPVTRPDPNYISHWEIVACQATTSSRNPIQLFNVGESPLMAFVARRDSTFHCSVPVEGGFCGYLNPKKERMLSHIRDKHLDHRPWHCGGQCGNLTW
jgi:hypothetical protein